jgi:Icc-related predicted phosphoesterase
MRILTVSDIEIGFIYSPMILERFQSIDLVISCGDLPYYYLEYILTMLNVPLYYVRGNHASKVEFTSAGERTYPWGAHDLHQQVVEDETGLILAGLEGCVQYNQGPYQYTQTQYWLKAFRMAPKLMLNKARFGRALDILVTHAPPWKIHDENDRPHQGIKAFRWLVDVFKPTYLLHGHIHIYRQSTITETQVGPTRIINTYGYRELEIQTPKTRSWQKHR